MWARFFVCNQIISYDSNLEKWENVKSTGAVPMPRCESAVTNIDDTVWLYGGTDRYDYQYHDRREGMDDLYALNMESLTWTQIHMKNGAPQPEPCFQHTFTAVSESQIVSHGGLTHTNDNNFCNHWIFDTASMSWREDNLQVPPRCMHSASAGKRSSVIILGGADNGHHQMSKQYTDAFHIVLKPGPKTLQDLAMQAMFSHRHDLTTRDLDSLPDNLHKRLLDM